MDSKNKAYKLRDYSKGIQFLRNDLLHNYELILALEANVPGVPRDVFIHETDSVQGVMSIDRFGADWVWVSTEASTESAARALLEQLPLGQEFNFLVHREWMKPLVQEMFGVEFTGTRFDYSVDQEHFQPIIQHDLRELGQADREMLEHYREENNLHPQWLANFLDSQSGDARTVMLGMIRNGELVAHVDIDHEIDEMRGVHPFTAEKHRGRGYGKSTMSTATQTVLDMGRIPYYEAGPDNAPAMKLAESLGYSAYQEVVWGKGMRER